MNIEHLNETHNFFPSPVIVVFLARDPFSAMTTKQIFVHFECGENL